MVKGISGRAWRTPRGLRVGDSRARMLRLYPGARYRGGAYPGWWLHSAQLPYGGPGPSQIVWALVTRGRVSSIRVWLGGAGD